MLPRPLSRLHRVCDGHIAAGCVHSQSPLFRSAVMNHFPRSGRPICVPYPASYSKYSMKESLRKKIGWMLVQAIPNHCFTFSLNRYHRMISGMMRPTRVLNRPPAVCPATHQL
jgi:hypothetical protein